MNSSEKVFYLKKNLRLASWIQLAVILGIIFLVLVAWTLMILFGFGGDIRLYLALLTGFVLLALSPTLLLNVSHLASRLKVSNQGLDYLSWPFYHIRCTWTQVQTVTQRKELIVHADILLLKSATEIGLPIAMFMRKRMGLDNQYFIPLNVWDSWPSGELADTLRDHAPFLFEKNLSMQSTQ